MAMREAGARQRLRVRALACFALTLFACVIGVSALGLAGSWEGSALWESDLSQGLGGSGNSSPSSDRRNVDGSGDFGVAGDNVSHDVSRTSGGGSAAPDSYCTDRNGAAYRPGEALVQLAPDVSVDELADGLASLGFARDAIQGDGADSLGWVKVRLHDGESVDDALAQLKRLGVVAGAQPNFVYQLLDDESQSSNSSGLAAASAPALTGQANSGTLAWHLRAIGADRAWESFSAGGKATVAIIDTGCDITHPAIKPHIKSGSARNVLTGTSDVSDALGHGTRVAGIVSDVIGGPDGDGAGAFSSMKIMPIKVMNSSTTDTLNLVKAYNYVLTTAKTHDVRVVSMSLGARQTGLSVSDAATLAAADAAFHMGVLSVFAGGNYESVMPYYCFPCDFSENGLGVVNLTRTDASVEPTKDTLVLDESSNFNVKSEKTKDVAAPGTDIETTSVGGGYTSSTGTSMACPVAAGIAALVFAANPSLTPGEAKSVICSAADDLVYSGWGPAAGAGFDAATGYGLVRADKSVQGAQGGFVKGTDSLLVGGSVQLSVLRSGSWSWSSSNPAIASVDPASGLVSGHAAGEAVIKATNGFDTVQRTVVVYNVMLDGPAYSSAKVGKPLVVSAYSNPVVAWVYRSSDSKIASVGPFDGEVVPKHVGKVTVTATHSALPYVQLQCVVTVAKGANTLSAKAKSVKVKRSKLRKRTQKIGKSKAFSVKKARGAVKFSVVKYDRVAKKRIKVSKTGVVTVKKGLRKGLYKLKVKVRAAGNADYKAASKTVTLSVRVS